ncbi:hypothetical protein MTQ01_01720 [Streptomyces sp. XM4193]|uniref:hypothetical protein n=1 Tax=Streptomyces sp. XM4193 TaxID=2929782 RepID=UPI001FF70662|nr:hypothetical protein [Streptomyces sp. XM4193]MCK1794762.1 hypothetical protein [Streptomyces sp. XM4193]
MRGTDTTATTTAATRPAPATGSAAAATGWRSTAGRRLGPAAAAALCLGLLTACGSDSEGGGYVNDGAAGPGSDSASGPQAPDEDVRLIPLKKEPPLTDAPDGERGEGAAGSGSGEPDDPAGGPGTAGGSDGAGRPGGGESGGSEGDSSGPPSPGETAEGPAKLSVGDHERAPGEERWCERVTFPVHNSGGAAVSSGSVTFTTRIVGLLGGTWGNVDTRQNLRAPIEAGARADQSYTVCVDSWRVPIGMSIETTGVKVDWK